MTRRRAVPIVKPPVTWILVGDAKQAQIYVRKSVERIIPMSGNALHRHYSETREEKMLPLSGMSMRAPSEKDYEVSRKQLGRVFESASSARHMSEPRIDVRDEIRQHFVKTIIKALHEAREQKLFDRLVVVAPAKMLGEIKKQAGDSLSHLIVAELSKDLTHCRGAELAEHLENII